MGLEERMWRGEILNLISSATLSYSLELSLELESHPGLSPSPDADFGGCEPEHSMS